MDSVLDDLTKGFKSFTATVDKSFTSIDTFANKLWLKAEGIKQQASIEDASAYSRACGDREAAKRRAELILQQLPPAYFDQSFDPLKHELLQMGDNTKQNDIDGMVERLSAAVEVVGVRLAKHVVKNQDKLVAGITNVAEVEDDLRAAHVICQGSRAQLRMAADEVQRQIKVITCTRKKQACMEVLEAVSKIKRIKDLHMSLRKVHEEGNYGQSIVLCADGFAAVEMLGAYKVAPELQLTVQRLYYDTVQRLDTALLSVCGSFTPEGYSTLLEAFLLQGLAGQALAGKVLACYKDLINDAASRLIRSMVIARAAFSGDCSSEASNHPDGSTGSPRSSGYSSAGLGDCTFEDMCKLLPGDLMQPCLTKIFEVVFELLSSYHLMTEWHKASLQQQDSKAAAAAAAIQVQPDSSQGQANVDPGSPAHAQFKQVQALTVSLLEGVSSGLAQSRAAVLDVAGARVKELLTAAGGKTKGDGFPKVVEGCLQFISVGEAFAGQRLNLSEALLSVLDSKVNSYHKSNMDALKYALAMEGWQPISSSAHVGNSSISVAAGAGGSTSSMKQLLTSSPYQLPTYGETGSIKEFSGWLRAGNPFTAQKQQRRQTRAVGGNTALPANTGQAVHSQQTDQAAVSPANSSRVATKSSLLILQWLSSYAALMTPFPAKKWVLWASAADLFDNFLLACFILFSGITLETLVWQEDSLPHRLRSALLRITTTPGCKYKAQIEELQRTKPATPPLAASTSFLDFEFGFTSSNSASPTPGGSSSPNRFDVFTRKFKDTMVELMNTDLSQPLPDSSHGQHSSSYMQQHQQQRTGSPAQAMHQQQHQQQQAGSPAGLGPGQQQAAAAPAGISSSILSDSSSNSNMAASGQFGQKAELGMDLARQSWQQQQQPGPSGRQFGLKERVVAIESLTAIADALKEAKSALLAQLGNASIGKEVEGYFARTVDAAQDLRDAIYRGGAKQLLTGVVDLDRGTAVQVASCNYAVKEPATRYQPWAESLVKQYRSFNDFLKASGLPLDVQQKMWEAAVKLGGDAILDGVARVRHCSLEGRAGMSLDLSAVDKGLRTMAPAAAMASLRLVDNYIKAFYIPWDDLARWAQTHVAEYGRAKIVVLVEAMAETYGVKRAQKAALIDKLNTELAEFG